MFVRCLPRVLPLRLQSGVAWEVVLHQEPGGGAIPDVHRRETGEEGKLVMGSYPSVEQAGDHRDGASEARAVWPRWVTGLPYLLPPLGRPIGGENMVDVGILRLDESRPRIAGGVIKG